MAGLLRTSVRNFVQYFRQYGATTHFWGPVTNWGFVVAGLNDMSKPPERISEKMTGVLCIYSLLFIRFGYVVSPRNYLLMSCHICNEAVQGTLLTRKLLYNAGRSGASQTVG